VLFSLSQSRLYSYTKDDNSTWEDSLSAQQNEELVKSSSPKVTSMLDKTMKTIISTLEDGSASLPALLSVQWNRHCWSSSIDSGCC
jgi:hypothetical protein